MLVYSYGVGMWQWVNPEGLRDLHDHKICANHNSNLHVKETERQAEKFRI